jgi:hypothetical protein
MFDSSLTLCDGRAGWHSSACLDDQVGEETPMPGDLLRKLMSVDLDGSVTVIPRPAAAADDLQRRR